MSCETMDQDICKQAEALLQACHGGERRLVTAESCTGGLIAAYLTEVAGSSKVFDRGFVTYSNEAKHALLGVPPSVIARHGAVSREVAELMAKGALEQSLADFSVAVTGIAGPGGGSKEKPVGTVHIAAASRGGDLRHEQCQFGDLGRSKVRSDTVKRALTILQSLVSASLC